VKATDKKSPPECTVLNPLDVFCFKFCFLTEEKEPNPGIKDGLHIPAIAFIGSVPVVYNTSINGQGTSWHKIGCEKSS